VFRDLGFSADEAANLKLRADLVIELSKLIKARRLTQAKASVDTLVAMLGHAGAHVALVVRPRSRVA
jgi:predicted XRE-type DNA-binding protein